MQQSSGSFVRLGAIAIPVSVVLAAFLLFAVQPLLAKALLPVLGGAAAVWIACLLFFQVALVLGYLYADLLARCRSLELQVLVHGGLLLLSSWALPLGDVPPDPGFEASSTAVVRWLFVTVGLPYVALAATSPLFQHWSHRAVVHAFPHRLYALSNAASMAALLAYPLLAEPWLDTSIQSALWTFGYALFGAASLASGIAAMRSPDAGALGDHPTEPLTWGAAAACFYFSACGSALLAGVTNHLCPDVASVPLLWLLPLSLYLASFVVAFATKHSRIRWGFALAWLAGTPCAAWALLRGPDFPFLGSLFLHGIVLFTGCVTLHGEIARRRPASGELTRLYLVLALGGAAGGCFVALVAPILFDGFAEYPIAVWVAVLGFGASRSLVKGGARMVVPAVIYAWALGILLAVPFLPQRDTLSARGFFGVLRVQEVSNSEGARARQLTHGRTIHGVEPANPSRWEPNGYYARESGVGLAWRAVHERRGAKPLRIGVVGLGTGSFSVWKRTGDRLRFYELDPLVVKIAQTQFRYLSRAPGDVELRLGDARASLRAEDAAGLPPFDLLVLDAFSGDAVPTHLLTKEAFDLYWRRLSPDGVLAVHVSNRHLDLARVAAGGVEATDGHARFIRNGADEARHVLPSEWIIASRDLSALPPAHDRGGSRTGSVVWRDDFANLIEVLRW
ncbi:MAG: fused MFS/spermidine synthase [Myxococcales bacterium]|nr:fused MFS/spermidine synthase [Myxococcales bacterium]